MSNAHRLSLSVQYASSATGLPVRLQFRRWVRAALQQDLQATLRIVDEHEGRALNHDYRGKDYATNVLTFVYDDTEPLTTQPPLSGGAANASPDKGGAGGAAAQTLYGDIVICAPVVAREAAEQGKTLLAHYAHLTLHAVLHLQGYDHDTGAEAAVMEALETALMLKLGYPDPYVVTT